MEIVTRYKNQKGQTQGYDVRLDNGKIKYLDRVAVINLEDQISNATLTKGADFRATKGNHIDTVVKYNTLVKRDKLPKILSSTTEFEYYGKEYINICKRIRKYALEDKLSVDLSKHKSNNGNNTHLFL